MSLYTVMVFLMDCIHDNTMVRRQPEHKFLWPKSCLSPMQRHNQVCSYPTATKNICKPGKQSSLRASRFDHFTSPTTKQDFHFTCTFPHVTPHFTHTSSHQQFIKDSILDFTYNVNFRLSTDCLHPFCVPVN